jgi:hypothetical protein
MLLLWIKVDSFIPIILPNLNPICHLLALGAHHILHVGRIRVNRSIILVKHNFIIHGALGGTINILGRGSVDCSE